MQSEFAPFNEWKWVEVTRETSRNQCPSEEPCLAAGFGLGCWVFSGLQQSLHPFYSERWSGAFRSVLMVILMRCSWIFMGYIFPLGMKWLTVTAIEIYWTWSSRNSILDSWFALICIHSIPFDPWWKLPVYFSRVSRWSCIVVKTSSDFTRLPQLPGLPDAKGRGTTWMEGK